MTLVNTVKQCHKEIYYGCCRCPRYASETSYYKKVLKWTTVKKCQKQKKSVGGGGQFSGGHISGGNFQWAIFSGAFFAGHFSGHQKLAYFLRNLQTSPANDLRILRIKNAKYSEYCFYTNTNKEGDFQIYMGVPLKVIKQPFRNLVMNYYFFLLSTFWRYH